MRVLILVDAYLPAPRSQAKLVHDLALEMRHAGHEVSVLSPSESVRRPFEVSREDCGVVVRVRGEKLKGIPTWLRALREEQLSSRIWSRARSWFRANPHDLVVYYSPTIFFGRLVSRLKRLWQARSYLILRDIFPQWAVDAGLIGRNGPAHLFFRMREFEQYRAADRIGVQSPKNLEYFSNGIQALLTVGRLEVLYNWTDVGPLAPPTEDFRGRLGLSDKVVFFYGGNIGVAQDLDNIVRLASSLRARRECYFLIVGEGSEVARLSAMIERASLTNIQILPSVDQHTYLGMVSQMDVGLVSLDRRLRTENFPGKILGYMQHSLPLLASVNPGNELGTLIRTHEIGFACENGDDEKLREHAERLASDADLRRIQGQAARRLLEQLFSSRNAAAQVLAGGPNR